VDIVSIPNSLPTVSFAHCFLRTDERHSLTLNHGDARVEDFSASWKSKVPSLNRTSIGLPQPDAFRVKGGSVAVVRETERRLRITDSERAWCLDCFDAGVTNAPSAMQRSEARLPRCSQLLEIPAS